MSRWSLLLLTIGVFISGAFASITVVNLGEGRYAFIYCNDGIAEYVNDFHITIEGATLVDMGPDGGPPGPEWNGHFTPGGYTADWWTSMPPDGDPIFPGECDTFLITVNPPDASFNYHWEATQDGMGVDYGDGTMLEINQNSSQPDEMQIAAYPNPFNSALTIELNGATEYAEISIIDINGRIIKNFTAPKSTYNYAAFRWDGTDKNGKKVPSGKYFITTKTKETTMSLPVDYIR